MASDRTGSFYAVLIIGAVTLIGVIAGLQLQLDQQMSRARRLKGAAEAALLARRGLEAAALELARTGRVPARAASTPQGGELVVVAEARPAGSRKYVVFARGRYAGAPVTMVADMTTGTTRTLVCNREVLYQDVDVDAPAARGKVIATRRAARAALMRTLALARGEGAGLSTRLSAFFATAAQGRIPQGDRTRIVSVLASGLTTVVP
jgi:hypothetical protein